MPRKSQLNGANGEATNSDDVNKKVDRTQNKRIQALEQKMRNMSVRQGKKKKSNRQKKPQAVNPFPGIPKNRTFNQDKHITFEPTSASIVAQVSPFRIPRGVAGVLSSAKPSQKFTARAIATITVAANANGLFFISPCIAQDANLLSALCYFGTPSALSAQTLAATTYASGVSATGMSTNTPYSSGVLLGGDYTWRLVSAGVRIRNVTAPVNRQGVLKYIVDYPETVINYQDGTTTMGSVLTSVDSNHRTVRRNLGVQPDIDITIPGSSYLIKDTWVCDPFPPSGGQGYWPLGASKQTVYNTPSSSYCPVGAIAIFPAVSVQQVYDVEIIEHWEVNGSAIETLHTPSPSHGLAADLVGSIISQSHHQHAMNPEKDIHEIAKGVAFAQHHKAALKDAACVASALVML